PPAIATPAAPARSTNVRRVNLSCPCDIAPPLAFAVVLSRHSTLRRGVSAVNGASQVPGTGVPGTSVLGLDVGGRADLAAVPLDELLDELVGVVVRDLPRRGLHQVGARAFERPGDAVVQGELPEPDGVDHDAGRVRRVPDLELQLDVQRHVAEARALEADVRPLAVFQPRHVVGWADVHGVGLEAVLDLARDRLGLGDLLRLQSLTLEHVLEVHVAAEVELVGPVDGEAPVFEEPGQDTVHDGGANLALDVVPDDGHAGHFELGGPFGVAGD